MPRLPEVNRVRGASPAGVNAAGGIARGVASQVRGVRESERRAEFVLGRARQEFRQNEREEEIEQAKLEREQEIEAREKEKRNEQRLKEQQAIHDSVRRGEATRAIQLRVRQIVDAWKRDPQITSPDALPQLSASITGAAEDILSGPTMDKVSPLGRAHAQGVANGILMNAEAEGFAVQQRVGKELAYSGYNEDISALAAAIYASGDPTQLPSVLDSTKARGAELQPFSTAAEFHGKDDDAARLMYQAGAVGAAEKNMRSNAKQFLKLAEEARLSNGKRLFSGDAISDIRKDVRAVGKKYGDAAQRSFREMIRDGIGTIDQMEEALKFNTKEHEWTLGQVATLTNEIRTVERARAEAKKSIRELQRIRNDGGLLMGDTKGYALVGEAYNAMLLEYENAPLGPDGAVLTPQERGRAEEDKRQRIDAFNFEFVREFGVFPENLASRLLGQTRSGSDDSRGHAASFIYATLGENGRNDKAVRDAFFSKNDEDVAAAITIGKLIVVNGLTRSQAVQSFDKDLLMSDPGNAKAKARFDEHMLVYKRETFGENIASGAAQRVMEDKLLFGGIPNPFGGSATNTEDVRFDVTKFFKQGVDIPPANALRKFVANPGLGLSEAIGFDEINRAMVEGSSGIERVIGKMRLAVSDKLARVGMDDSFLKIFDAPAPFRQGTPEHLGAIVKWMNLSLEDTARAQEVPEWLIADFMATFDQMAILTGGDGDAALLLTQQTYADVDYTDRRQDTEPRWSRHDIFKVYGGNNPKHHAKIAEELAAFIAGQKLPAGTRYMIEAAPGWDLGPNPQRDQYGRRMPPFMLLTRRPGEDGFTPATLNRTVAVPTFIEQPEPTSPVLEGKVNLNPLKQDVPNRLVRGALTNLHRLLRDDDGNYRPGKPFVITGGSRARGLEPAGHLSPTGFVSKDGRPILFNESGHLSSELTVTLTTPRLNDGRPTVVPSIWNGKQLTNDDEIVDAVIAAGELKKWPVFGPKDPSPKQLEAAIKEAGRWAGARSKSLDEESVFSEFDKEHKRGIKGKNLKLKILERQGKPISRSTGELVGDSASQSKHLIEFGSTAADVRESSFADLPVDEVRALAVEAGFDPDKTRTPQFYRDRGENPHWHFGLSDTAANRAGINADQGEPVIIAGRPTAIPILFRPNGALPQVIADAQEMLNIKSSELDLAALEKQYDDDVARGTNPDQAAFRAHENAFDLPDLMEKQDKGLETFSGFSAGQQGRLQ
jgi:hypothetical protein